VTTEKKRVHRLKIQPEHYSLRLTGKKDWEYRINDRDFQVGDLLLLEEFVKSGNYTGLQQLVAVEAITRSELFREDYVVLSTRTLEAHLLEVES
jgi:hypothetical protein